MRKTWGALATLLLASASTSLGTGCAQEGARRPPVVPDYERPFQIVLAEYAVPIALGVASPGSVGGWDEGVSLERWVKGWTHRPLSRDSDDVFVNYVLHPVAGSETHILARSHGWSFGEAFLFDLFASFTWEYVYENVFEPPSRRDLLVTGPAGALLGELRFQLKEAGVLPGLMDPLGDHGEPFVEMAPEGLLFGIQRRF